MRYLRIKKIRRENGNVYKMKIRNSNINKSYLKKIITNYKY